MTVSQPAWHNPARQLADALAAADRADETALLLVELHEHVLPRLSDGPLVVVLGGSTGVGTSTLLNSLVQNQVSGAGVLRPTTRVPVLVHHPEHDPASVADALPEGVELVSDSTVPTGLVLIDAPDLDSVAATNREMARRLLDVADLWLMVTSPARYADAVPWTHLRRAVARRTPVAVVLNRVPAADHSAVSTDLAHLLAAEGLGDSPLLVVPELAGAAGLLPADAVAEVRELLGALAQDETARTVVRRTSAEGAAADVATRAAALARDWSAGDSTAARVVRDAAVALQHGVGEAS